MKKRKKKTATNNNKKKTFKKGKQNEYLNSKTHK